MFLSRKASGPFDKCSKRQPIEALSFNPQPLGQRFSESSDGRLLIGTNCILRQRSDELGKFQGLSETLSLWLHAGDKTNLFGLLGINHSASNNQFESPT